MERIRPSVYLHYHVDLGEDQFQLNYCDLQLEYLEETVKQSGRGYSIVAKTKPVLLKIPGQFATSAAEDSNGSENFDVRVELDQDVMRERGVTKLEVLPYGRRPVSVDDVRSCRREGALEVYLVNRLTRNFAVDAIRSIIGDFETRDDILSKKEQLVATFRNSPWLQKIYPIAKHEDISSALGTVMVFHRDVRATPSR